MNTNRMFQLSIVLLIGCIPFTFHRDACSQTTSSDSGTTEPIGLTANDPVNGATADDTGIKLNFRGASLESVLDYLSQEAGFVIVLETKVEGRVDLWSHQSITKDEAVDLLNTILNQKGYAAIRNGRVLTVVNRDEAKQKDLPVRSGNNPEQIPKTDEMVTQIIPVRYTDAVKLVENISSLIPEYATLSANESSNAIVLTDTQANVRRISEIIKALDTSISSISTVQVFPLVYAEATEVADMVTKIFETDGTTGNQNNQRNNFFARFQRGGGRGGPPDDSQQDTNSDARQAASRVVAVGDERTNSLVVSAPDELMSTVAMVVEQIDKEIQDTTEIRVFKLQHADAVETAEIIAELFPDENQTSQNQQTPRFGRGGFFGGPPGANQQQSTDSRTVKSNTVYAVADARTNSLVVSAQQETMERIERAIEQLDANPAKKQKVYVYRLENADVENVAGILRTMFEEQTIGTSSSSSTSQSQINLNNPSTLSTNSQTQTSGRSSGN